MLCPTLSKCLHRVLSQKLMRLIVVTFQLMRISKSPTHITVENKLDSKDSLMKMQHFRHNCRRNKHHKH
jgi:hypothetical protein